MNIYLVHLVYVSSSLCIRYTCDSRNYVAKHVTEECFGKNLESDWFIFAYSHGEDILGMYNDTLYTIMRIIHNIVTKTVCNCESC